MIIKCTCSDLVNNGDHYCPIHGMFAKPTPPEGEAVTEQAEEFEMHITPRSVTRIPIPAPVVSTPDMTAAEHLKQCCACNHGRTPCIEYQRNWPVVSTAATEPDAAHEHILKEYLTEGYGIEFRCKICGWKFGDPVAPESYKPAEGPDFCECPNPYEGARPLHTPRFCERCKKPLKLPAATPVTVEAPDVEKIVHNIIQSCGLTENCRYVLPLGAKAFLTEMLLPLATPKPIGDVEAVARQIANATVGAILHAANKEKKITLNYLDEMTIEITAILSPFFAPAGPENKEKK